MNLFSFIRFSPFAHIGLLTPDQVVERTLAFAKDHRVPLNALEGFLRQIIGWREFMRAVYLLKQDQERKTNFFNTLEDCLPRSTQEPQVLIRLTS